MENKVNTMEDSCAYKENEKEIKMQLNVIDKQDTYYRKHKKNITRNM